MKIVGNNELKLTAGENISIVVSEENSPLINEAMHTRGQSILFNDGTEIIKIDTEDDFILLKFNDILGKIILIYHSDNKEGQTWGLLNDGFSNASESHIHKFTVLKDTTLFLATEQSLLAAEDPYALDFGDDKLMNSNLIPNIPNALVLDLEKRNQ